MPSIITRLVSAGNWNGFKEKTRKSVLLPTNPPRRRRPLQPFREKLGSLAKLFRDEDDLARKLHDLLLLRRGLGTRRHGLERFDKGFVFMSALRQDLLGVVVGRDVGGDGGVSPRRVLPRGSGARVRGGERSVVPRRPGAR